MNLIKNFDDLTYEEKIWEYLTGLKPTFDKNAVFHDASAQFRYPYEPEKHSNVTFRIRTGKYNAVKVILCLNNNEYVMTKETTDEYFDYYISTVRIGEEKVRYRFKIVYDGNIIFYNRQGLKSSPDDAYDFMIYPGFKTPSWARGAIMYQIYVDRFCNADASNDVVDGEYFYVGDRVKRITDWDKYPDQMGVREFYGGDLEGVISKLDYLKDLGIECIYFNPLFVSPSNHKYDIQDYDYIDPHFGKIVEDGGECLPPGECDNSKASKYIARVTNLKNLEASNALFAELVEKAHERGIRVIIDGVFNHCGSFNKWLDREKIYENSDFEKGAYIRKDSIFHDFFQFNDENHWPYNNTYNGWWGFDTLPKLNYEGSQKLEDYILEIGRKWVSPPYNADGWRLDVAADLGMSPQYNHSFWKRFRKAVKSANPNAIILAEHYGDSSYWLKGDEWDTIMNYDAFMEPVTWFLTGMDKHSDSYNESRINNSNFFFSDMEHFMTVMGDSPVQISMNELSNHDHSRFLTRTNRTPGRTASRGPEAAQENVARHVMREAVVMQMTWPGAPTIYYGDEAGVCGWTDPDNRRTYPWGHEDMEMIDFHKLMISMRKNNPALKYGSLIKILSDGAVLSYGRFTQNNHVIVVVNNDDKERKADINAYLSGCKSDEVLRQAVLTDENGFKTDVNEIKLNGGCFEIMMPPFSAAVFIGE